MLTIRVNKKQQSLMMKVRLYLDTKTPFCSKFKMVIAIV